MRPRVSLRKALSDPLLLGDTISGPSWLPWRTLLLASQGEQLLDDERKLFTELTHREREPLQPVEEAAFVIGRRGGKSRAVSVLASYTAALCDHPSLVKGERGTLLVIAPDQRQADVVFNYVVANFEASPILQQLIEAQMTRSLRLRNRIDVEVRAADYRRLRGLTLVKCIVDEVAFLYSDESANPDTEILNAVRPGLATTSGQLFLISSPYARRGELWRAYTRHFGPNGDASILVAQAPSRVMNPSLSQSVVDRAFERDAASADAEFGAQFRRDLDSPFSIEAVQAVVERGCYERSPVRGVDYSGFVDPSGGSADSFTLGIAHTDRADWQKPIVTVDALREVPPPFSRSNVVADFVKVLKDYNITKIVGDKYAGEWPVESFGKLSVTYEQSAQPKSDLYRDLLPLINSGRIRLLDHQKLVNQLVGLERRVARGGRDSIDHAPHGHDDLANCVAGVAAITNKYPGYLGGDLYDLWCN